MMMRARQTLLRISLVAALALGLLTASGIHGTNTAHAQSVEVTGPLAGAPAVMDQRLWRDMRFHIEPFFAFTIADEYSRSLIVGGELRFHFLDWLGLGVGWSDPDDASLRDEYVIESFWRMQLTPTTQISVDVQLWLNPSTTPGDDVQGVFTPRLLVEI